MTIASQGSGRTAPLLRSIAGALLLLGASMAFTATAKAQRVSVATATTRNLAALSPLDAGPVPQSQPIHLTLALVPDAAHTAALDQFLASVVDPTSSSYHQFLTPRQFAESYGASPAQIAAATAWAQAQGFSVDAVSAGGTQIRVTGNAAQVQTAFAVSLHQYQSATAAYYANQSDPSLDPTAATLFSSVLGLDNLPLAGSLTISPYGHKARTPSTIADSILALLDLVDRNTGPLVTIDSALCSTAFSAPQLDQFRAIFRQAAAQGITIIASSACASSATESFPASFPEVTAAVVSGTQAATSTPSIARPAWQVANGLPSDGMRDTPDLTVSSLGDFANTLVAIGGQTSSRLGVVNATLYKLAPISGLYTQPDDAPAGTWEAETGLGAISLTTLTKVYPRGTSASFTSFSSTSYSPIHGASVTFNSSVTTGSTTGAMPTGTVSFMTLTGTTLGTVNLSNGNASFTFNTLAGGNYTVYAAYSGDGTYAASTSPTSQIAVQPEPSALTATLSGAAVIGGNVSIIVTDTASSGVGTPSGAVSVSLPSTGSTYSGTLSPTTGSSAVATVTFPAPAVGSITLSVNCTTSLSYSCYNPLTTTVTIAKATPTLTISYTPNPPVSGAVITLNASVGTVGTAPVPTGNVVFSDNSTVLNAGALANGTTTTTGIVPATTTHSISATYDGDANYNTVTTSAGTTTGGAIATTTTLATSANTVVAGQTIVLTATVSPNSTGTTPATGTVQFYDGTTLLGTSTLNSWMATLNVNNLSATVNHTVTAIYIGDTNYTGSTSNAVTIAKAVVPIVTTTTLTASATTVTAGQAIVFTASINAASTVSSAPSGTVQFLDGTTLLGSVTLSQSTTVTLSVSTLSSTVNHTITAVYSGDNNYAGSTSAAVTISKATTLNATTTTLTVIPATATQGSAVSFSATVGPTVNSTAPTGTVQFLSGGSVLCTATLSASVGTCSTTLLPVGTDSITAIYLGDTNYATSTSAAATVTVSTNVAVNSTLIASISPSVSVLPGATATITAILNAPVGLVPAGSITATITGVSGATYSTTLPGTPNTSTLTVTIPVPTPSATGTYSVVVACNGTNFACLPVTLTMVVSLTAKIATTTVLTVSSNTVAYGTTITLTASVTPASTGSSVLSGTVIFYNGSTAVGSGTILNGVATSSVVITNVSNTFTAVYSGDTNYASSTSSTVTVTSSATPSGQSLTSNVYTSLAGYDIVLTLHITGSQISGTSGTPPTPTGKAYFYDTFQGQTTLLGIGTVGSTGGIYATAGMSTTGLTLGTHEIQAVYSGDANYASETSNDIAIVETDYNALPTFPLTLSLTPGSSGTVYYNVNFLGGMVGLVNLSCTAPTGSEITCGFSPSTVQSNGGATVLTVTTTAGTAKNHLPPALWQATGGIVCAGLLGLFWPKRRRSIASLAVFALALAIMSNLGCGQTALRDTPGANETSGTPAGTIALTINTSGYDGVSTSNHNYTYTVTVQ